MTENPNTVTLGLVQMRCTPEPSRNMAAAIRGVRDAAARGAQIVCLQELFRSQYFCQTEDHGCFDLAEPVPGPSTEELGALAAELGLSALPFAFASVWLVNSASLLPVFWDIMPNS